MSYFSTLPISVPSNAIGLIGSPVSHSKSPIMMNKLLETRQLQNTYIPLCVQKEELPFALAEMISLGFIGFNVTIPHKETIIKFLDGISPQAKKINAVNTVVINEQQLIGHNTDGDGYLQSLQEEYKLPLTKQKVILLGTGGAAKAVAFSLAESKVQSLTIAGRSLDQAMRLATSLSSYTNVNAVSIFDCATVIAEATMLINATPIGMVPQASVSPIPVRWLHEQLLVSDLVYNPMETLLLKEARAVGAKVHNGLGMLVKQAALAYKLWFNELADEEIMLQTLVSSLGSELL